MQWFVYILKCADQTLYTGITNDPARRLKQHNLGVGAKYTANRLPVELVWIQSTSNRSTALKKEFELKQLTRDQKHEIINSKVSNMDTCIFCSIADGTAPAHKIWEDDTHLAFLSIYPNTQGFSVVIPKKHYPSYALDQPPKVLTDLIMAAQKVAQLLDSKLEDVGRTGLILEGFGVDHLHAKLFPMHGTKSNSWQAIESKVDKYFEKYEGYISSHDYTRADDKVLAELAKKISS